MTTARPADDDPPHFDAPPTSERWLHRLAVCTSLVFLLGLFLRLTVRDRFLYGSTLFYALPLPVLTVLVIVAAGLFRRVRCRKAARLWGLAALCTGLWCMAAMGGWRQPVGGTGEAMRILCWNTCRGWLGWNYVAAAINEFQPDVAGLVEAGETGETRRSFWTESCPGYHVSMLGGGIVCLTKEPPGDGIAVQLPGDGEYRRLDVTAHGQSVTLLIVDLQSNPLHSREATLKQLAADAEKLADDPVVIMGDFNTPSDSVHFDELRKRYHQAFETAGSGYLATWPVPLPVLCLDHIWVSDRVRVDDCTHRWTAVSDHRPVVADVTVVP